MTFRLAYRMVCGAIALVIGDYWFVAALRDHAYGEAASWAALVALAWAALFSAWRDLV